MDGRITRYFSGQLSKEECIHLLQDREEDQAIKDDFTSIQNLWAITHLSSIHINQEEGEKAYIQIEKKIKQKQLWLMGRKIARYAAVIAITLITTILFITNVQKPDSKIVVTQQELFVPAGQRARITLPDGSVAWLNAGSSLYYPSQFDKKRRVKLIGEGFFEVAKDKNRPFIVVAGQIEIKALGTQFNVCNYPKAKILSATLTSGSIVVYPTGKEKDGQMLNPNQQLIVTDGKFKLEKNVDLDKLLWKEGIYSFKKEKMRDIVKKLELYFDVEIIVNNPRILEYEYTGKFRHRDGLMEILRIIQKIHHFKIESNEELNKITLS